MSDSEEFQGKVAIVTGSGRGMGKAIANRLSSGGAIVVVTDVNDESVEQTALEIRQQGGQAMALPGDVTSRADVEKIAEFTNQRYSNIDILVNSAGVLRTNNVIDLEEEEWDLVLTVNLKGTYLWARAVLPYMRQGNWGRIINLSSTAGRKYSTLGGAHYTASKAGVLGFTRHLAKEEAGNGITVNAICPGLVDTEMVHSTINEDRVKQYADSFPISRLGNTSEVAELTAFIASDKAAYMTGVSFDINGGDLMM
jgi:3-oxoacyl-[acyl-carrier protein] reductase